MFAALKSRNIDHICDIIKSANVSELNMQDAYNNTPLHFVIFSYTSNDIATLLIMRGVELNVTNADGYTPLHLAIKYKNIDIAKLLIECGADTRIKDIYGNTPLELAFNYELLEIIVLIYNKKEYKIKFNKDYIDFIILHNNQQLVSSVSLVSLVSCFENIDYEYTINTALIYKKYAIIRVLYIFDKLNVLKHLNITCSNEFMEYLMELCV